MKRHYFIVLIDGVPYMKDNAIRTYKTRSRAEKESQWFVERGRLVEIGELSLKHVEQLKGES